MLRVHPAGSAVVIQQGGGRDGMPSGTESKKPEKAAPAGLAAVVGTEEPLFSDTV